MSTSVPAVLAAYAAGLSARPALAGVVVSLIDTGAWKSHEEIIFGQVTAPQARIDMDDPGTEESATLTGYLVVELGGDGDTAAATAQARAGVLLDEMVAQLDDDPDFGGAIPAGMAAPLLTQATWTTKRADQDGASKIGVGIDWMITWSADL